MNLGINTDSHLEIFGGSPESYNAGKRHGEAFREAIDNCAAIGFVLYILSRGRIRI